MIFSSSNLLVAAATRRAFGRKKERAHKEREIELEPSQRVPREEGVGGTDVSAALPPLLDISLAQLPCGTYNSTWFRVPFTRTPRTRHAPATHPPRALLRLVPPSRCQSATIVVLSSTGAHSSRTARVCACAPAGKRSINCSKGSA
jgi:hypothetical protein